MGESEEVGVAANRRTIAKKARPTGGMLIRATLKETAAQKAFPPLSVSLSLSLSLPDVPVRQAKSVNGKKNGGG